MQGCAIQFDYSVSVKSLSYMVSIDFLPVPLIVSEECPPICIEVVRRSENDPVSAESY